MELIRARALIAIDQGRACCAIHARSEFNTGIDGIDADLAVISREAEWAGASIERRLVDARRPVLAVAMGAFIDVVRATRSIVAWGAITGEATKAIGANSQVQAGVAGAITERGGQC